MIEVPAAPGTYALVLRLRQRTHASIGALGAATFPVGWYVYLGSARSPGGIAARVGHHVRGAERPHWHVDYLRQIAEVEEVWWRQGAEPRECEWAAAIRAAPGAEVILPGFGASDCRCPSHLLYFRRKPSRLLAPQAALP